ncbi:MAG: hypothetical protein OEY58_19605 [Gammaproteobacteria bacterium]|nr:hypothetical protein [Gammaproteobacteria bacterium]
MNGLSRFVAFHNWVIALGALIMVYAGYYLVLGFSQIDVAQDSKTMFVLFGVFIQCMEAVCFFGATVTRNMAWRFALIAFGIPLFAVSVFFMTIAQMSSLEDGERQAQSVDMRATQLRDQIASLDTTIAGYRLNAEKQSQSKFAQSRALGMEALKEAQRLEDQKNQLSQELFALTQQRKTTSSDLFGQAGSAIGVSITGYHFYLLRSFLLELGSILILSFGGYLRQAALQSSQQVSKANQRVFDAQTAPSAPMAALKPSTAPVEPVSEPVAPMTANDPGLAASEPPDPHRAEDAVTPSKPVKRSTLTFQRPSKTTSDQVVVPFGKKTLPVKPPSNEALAQKVLMELQKYDSESELKSLSRDSIKIYLGIGSGRATKILRMIKAMEKSAEMKET